MLLLQHVATISYVAFFQNHVVERMWVEVNTRINYPIKETLIKMMEQGQISLDDELCKYCVSWYTLRVANVGIGLLLAAWNEHPIPCKFIFN